MTRKFFIIGAIMIASLLGAQAFAAGSDDYAPTAAKPAAYNKALALIKYKNYGQAIVSLKKAEAATKKRHRYPEFTGVCPSQIGQAGRGGEIL